MTVGKDRGKTKVSSGDALRILASRFAGARAKGAGTALNARARRLAAAYLDAARQRGESGKDVVAAWAAGGAALTLGTAAREAIMANPPAAVREAACTPGCAFCCILRGGDGGTITEAEATALHTALLPFAGQPDGRDWHPEACAALDPETRACRVYDDRPMVCRSFISTDAEACRSNAEGGAAAGAGLVGSHLDYLAVHALAREALRGLARVSTYSLARVAAGAVSGETVTLSLDAARHAPRALDDACRDAARAAGPASSPG